MILDHLPMDNRPEHGNNNIIHNANKFVLHEFPI